MASDRAIIEQALAFHGLVIDSYKPGDVRLYAVTKSNSGERLSSRMTFAELRAWAQGFIVGREGKKAVRF